MTNHIAPPATARTLLRTALGLDAAVSGAMGLVLVLAAGPLAALLRIPEPLLRYVGLVLFPYAAWVAYVGTRPAVARGQATAVVAVNAVWAASSILLLVGALVSPTTLGVAFVVLQALVVFAFAEAQWIGLRRVARAGAIA